MAIHIKNLKVRARKTPTQNICGQQLAAMLGCWAATNDFGNMNACKEFSQALFQCMRTTPLPKKQPRPAINYHLARLGKKIQ